MGVRAQNCHPWFRLFAALAILATPPAALAVAATGITRIAAGWHHTIAFRADGTVWAWGKNADAQLGDGTTTQRDSPVKIIAYTSVGSTIPASNWMSVTAVAAGSSHSAAIVASGDLWVWGSNLHGKIGDGRTTQRVSPLAIDAFASAALGPEHTVAVKSDGTLWSWGWNFFGQLGDGTTTDRSTPVQIGAGFASAATNNVHTVAVKTDASLWAFGSNFYGQLGDGTTNNSATPVRIGTGFVSAAAGFFHTVAIKSDGSLWAWGRNHLGQLGDGSTNDRMSPVQIGTGFATVAAGGNRTVAIKTDGSLWAWGDNVLGQLGDGTTTQRESPVSIGTGFTVVAASAGHTVAIKTDGALWAWGDNTYGQIGDGTNTQRSSPVQIGTGYGPVTGDGISLNLVAGWNLVGNGSGTALNVAAAFGDSSKVTTVWKWVAAKAKWAFYAPALGDGGVAYAAGQGFDFMTSVAGGEGFWVNAKTPFSASLPAGATISSANFQGLPAGWSMIATGDNVTPRAFNNAIGLTPPSAGAQDLASSS